MRSSLFDQSKRSLFGDLAIVVFLFVQCFDGIFTYLGVESFGVGIEANPLVANLMLVLGHGPALMGTKVLAIVMGALLHLREIHTVVAVLAGFYLFVAILPWINLLYM